MSDEQQKPARKGLVEETFGDSICHPERSEGSGSADGEILRGVYPRAEGRAQNDIAPLRMTFPGSMCELDAEGHCITCSDEALPVRVLRVDEEMGLAVVEVQDTTEEIDVTLVDEVVPGDVLLVHGGVAIGRPQGPAPTRGRSEANDK